MIIAARLLALISILVIVLSPQELFQIFRRPELQLIVATFVVIVLVMYDALTGLILGLALIALYVKLYNTVLAMDSFIAPRDNRNKGPMACLMDKYITKDHLTSAQSNVVDETQLDTQVVGIPSISKDQVFGAQGMYTQISGVDHISDSFAEAHFK